MSLTSQYRMLVFSWLFFLFSLFFVAFTPVVEAVNIINYKDVISDSAPSVFSNHTISFILDTDLSAGGQIEITPPAGFTVLATSTFAERNVELLVDGVERTAGPAVAAGVDMVEITAGTPGLLRYTLAPDFSITAGSELVFKIGNHTSNSQVYSVSHSTSTGTTTTASDIEPILNSSTLGRHDLQVRVYDGGLIANADPVIFLIEKVSIPNLDTTETIPPFRFNPAPTSSVGGTTLNVEISLETDEFAWCNYDTVAGTDYFLMPHTFSNTGLIYHSTVVAVVPDSVQQFFVRCIDDEGNFNIDDFEIIFTVNEIPTGQSNTEGSTDGDGTGTGDEGTGDGSGSGGTTGESDGQEPLQGGSTGTGGSGGGGGGGRGEDTGSTGGGGFESSDGLYRSGDGRVIISGYAFPDSKVSFLIDGQYFDNERSGRDGSYSVTLDEIARGVYTFGVYAEGPDGTKSSTFSTSFTVTGARTTALSNINVVPSILVEPDPVNPGQNLTFSGYALPNSTVTIENGVINAPSVKTLTATADGDGEWSLEVDTSRFSRELTK